MAVHILITQLTLGGEWTWEHLFLWLKSLLLTEIVVHVEFTRQHLRSE